jgi:cholesterol oxidase
MEYIRPPGLAQQRWAEFEAPLPQDMQNKNDQAAANALLVLLVYDESPGLAEAAYRVMSLTRNVEMMLVFSDIGRTRGRRALEYKIALDQKIDLPAVAAAGLVALERHARLHGGPVALETRSATGTANAADADAAGAALDALVNLDGDLMAGIIPYEPPGNPPSAPDPAGTSFALASCQYPSGILDGSIAFAGYARIAARLRSGAGIVPRFMVFAGDQVYVDPTAGLYDPSNLDDRYRLPYENWLRNENVRQVLRQIPSFMLLDDHEIADNWEPVADPDTKTNHETRTAGLNAFHKYQRGLAKSLEDFTFDGYPFFMLDTRSSRTHRKLGDLANAALFDKDRMGRLKAFLTATSGPKFVISPVMILPRHARAVQRDTSLDSGNLGALHSDGWDGYPKTMREVLGFIAANAIPNVVFLSGDEHRACVASAQLTDDAGNVTRFHSVHTSAMYSPFPFANSLDEQFIDSETIAFEHENKNYHCIVNVSRPARRDGATFFFVRESASEWLLDCEFADGSKQTLVL